MRKSSGAMKSFAGWLREIGLESYESIFADNDIDFSVARELSEVDLKELGLSLGHRKKFLSALSALDFAPEVGTTAAPAQDAQPAPTGERRQLTVMFCDLVGSTALAERLDPEELRALLHDYRTQCGKVIARYEGHVARYVGDGILTYFGWPAAHEEDAERSIRAALDIVQAVKTVPAPEMLSVRIGIATGPVVVGEQAGEGDQSKLAVGSTPNLAARLQGLAEADQIVIANSTRRLIANAFELIDLGGRALKGFADAVRAWRVEAVAASEGRFEATRAADNLTPLVGREEEIALLLRRWQQAKDGEGQVMLLCGEPGIGKSRITQELQTRISAEPHTRLRFQCSPYHTQSPLYPVITQFAQGAGFARDDTVEQKLDKLEVYLRLSGTVSSTTLALFAAMLSLPVDRYPPLQFSPQRQKEETIKALGEQMRGLAALQTVLFLFEDAHWSDPTTLEALDLVVHLAPGLRVLVAITFWLEFQPSWTGQSHVTLLTLNRLARKQAAAMIIALTGGKPVPDDGLNQNVANTKLAGAKTLPAELLEQILAKTDGVPLFVEELTKSILESGELKDAGDHFDYAGSARAITIPATLRDSLMARLDRVMPVKEIAQVGAAIGREFSYELIAAVAPLEKAALDDGLERLTESGLASRRGTIPDALYTFKHALVQDAAYDSLLKSRRQQLHGKIARVLEERFPDIKNFQPELLAHHFIAAGIQDNDNRERAIRYLELAGDKAKAKYVLEQALSNYRQTIELLEGWDKTPKRMREQIDIAVKWAELVVPSAELIDALKRSQRYAEQLDDKDRLGKATSCLGQMMFYVGDLQSAIPELQRAVEMAKGRGDQDWVGSSHRCLGQLYLWVNRRAEGLDCIETARPIVHRLGNRFEESCCLGLIALENGLTGRFNESFSLFDDAIRVAQEGAEQSIEGWNDVWQSEVSLTKGAWQEAAATCDEAIALGDRIENVWIMTWAIISKGCATFMAGNVDPGLSLTRQGVQRLEESGAVVNISTAFGLLAEMLCLANQPDEAAAYADKAVAHLRHGSGWAAATRAYRARAMAAAKRADWKSAASDMQKSLSSAQTLGYRPDLAVSHFRYAELLRNRSDLAQASSQLDEASELFTEMEMTWWISEASKLRAEFGSPKAV